MTWGRKTGGRKKGTPNNEGLQPLDYMLQVMRDPTASEVRRDMMAKAAAPYRHPQLAAVAHRAHECRRLANRAHGDPHDHTVADAKASADVGWADGTIIVTPILSGLHHRFARI